MQTKQCANGMVGYLIDADKSYVPRNPCKNPSSPGHILCPQCRASSGGYLRPAPRT